MAEWTAAYVNDLPDSAFACIDAGGTKDEGGRTVPRSNRHYPHHDAEGQLDLPHLRNALSRAAQTSTAECGEDHLAGHARGQGVGKAEDIELGLGPLVEAKAAPLEGDDLDAWWAGRIPRRLLAIPFTGPLRFPDGKSRDVDLEYFDERTDIRADWFPARPVDWHHSKDPSGIMNGVVIGKADRLGNRDGVEGEPDEFGWWVDLWMKAGEARLALIRRLVDRGAQLFGSTYAYPPMVQRGKAGHIDVWPYMMQTLSTSPQNTHSTLQPAKAVLAAFDTADISVSDDVLRRMLAAIEDLRDLSPATATGRLDPAPDLSDQLTAKAGRELSGANLAELESWLEALDGIATRARDLRDRVRSKYTPEPAEDPTP